MNRKRILVAGVSVFAMHAGIHHAMRQAIADGCAGKA